MSGSNAGYALCAALAAWWGYKFWLLPGGSVSHVTVDAASAGE